MAFFETARVGAVFTVSSIAWVMALPHNGNRYNVSRITANVFDRFLDSEPVVCPGQQSRTTHMPGTIGIYQAARINRKSP